MIVEPQVFLIGESTVNKEGLSAFLTHLGVPEWSSNASTDIELLTEVYGRACYKSFGTELNPNLTRVRGSNETYISNVIEKGDGSVLEHGVANFFFCDVSRVFTHELVRHRVGTAMSQESLRYVRLTDLDWYAPICIQENAAAMTIFEKTMDGLSNLQKDLSELYELDTTNDFNFKKQITSAMRRIAPIGLATNIGWSCNMRTLRHVIEMRTDPGAEEEIRIVFSKVADIAIERWPNLFADYEVDIINDLPSYKTVNKKV
ncbi:thymidylate synthase (FAD) [Candidatus Pacearchaeota archaeon]|nr:thymidylate synthase (FAD) [Candidatus Pacearchaeota archaeon]|tara:strand:- start:8093 stop:8872 length:780 start_codon:yes stop_codon:yes gene_type:complete